jgi:hypothetical protein
MNNSDIYLIILCASVLLILASVAYLSMKEKQARDKAERTIADSNIKHKPQLNQNDTFVYKKPKFVASLAIVFSITMFLLNYFEFISLRKDGYPPTFTTYFVQGMFFGTPIIYAFHQFIYKITINCDSITIRAFTTKKVQFSEILNIKTDYDRGSFLQIDLTNGKREFIAFDLIGIEEFIELLSYRLKN